jgi:predicted nucleic acid-binding protein
MFLADQRWLSNDDNVFSSALNLRIKHKIKTPDALHLATAIENGCTEFWANDNRLNEAAKHLAVNISQTISH